MAVIKDVEEHFQTIECTLEKKKMILEGLAEPCFTTADNMLIYTYVYNLCTNRTKNFSNDLYDLYVNAVNGYIQEQSVGIEKHPAELLDEVTQKWSKVQSYAQSISVFFTNLKRCILRTDGCSNLEKVPLLNFFDLIILKHHQKLQQAVLKLITDYREGKKINQFVVKNFLQLLMHMEESGAKYCYSLFEDIILEEAGVYMKNVAENFYAEIIPSNIHKTDYLLKELCRELNIHETIDLYPEKTGEKLMQIVDKVCSDCVRRWSFLSEGHR